MIITARFLGVVGFGKISYALSFTWIFLFLADLGLTDLFIRDVSQRKELLEEYVNNIITIKIFIGLLSCLVIILLDWRFSHEFDKFVIILILGATVVLDSFTCFFRSIYSIRETMQYQALLIIIEGVIKLGLVIPIVFFSPEFMKTIFISSVLFGSSLLNAFINFFAFLKSNLKIRLAFDYLFWRKKIKSGLPFMLIYILSLINFRVDTIIIYRVLGDRAVGLFSSNFRLIEQFFIIPTILSFVLFPVFSRLSESLIKMRKLLKIFIIVLFFSAMLAILVCYTFGQAAINIIYGKDFSDSYCYFKVLSWVMLPFFVKSILEKILFSFGKELLLCFFYFLGILLNVGLGFILIKSMGINGVSLATIISEVLMVVVCIVIYSESYRYSSREGGETLAIDIKNQFYEF